jgi:hypothetical protein
MALTGKPPAQEQNIYDLLSPYGWAGLICEYAGRLDIQITLRCEPCEDTLIAIRAYLTGQALAVLAALEAAGAEIYSSEITLSKPPVEGKVRAEVSDVWR